MRPFLPLLILFLVVFPLWGYTQAKGKGKSVTGLDYGMVQEVKKKTSDDEKTKEPDEMSIFFSKVQYKFLLGINSMFGSNMTSYINSPQGEGAQSTNTVTSTGVTFGTLFLYETLPLMMLRLNMDLMYSSYSGMFMKETEFVPLYISNHSFSPILSLEADFFLYSQFYIGTGMNIIFNINSKNTSSVRVGPYVNVGVYIPFATSKASMTIGLRYSYFDNKTDIHQTPFPTILDETTSYGSHVIMFYATFFGVI